MKISNKNHFFKKSIGNGCSETVQSDPQSQVASKTESLQSSPASKGIKVYASPAVAQVTKKTSEVLANCGLNVMAKRVEQILSDSAKERFTISVVGEFSRGKSTLLNKLLDNAAALPVANLPTTAVMTCIRYASQSKMAIFNENGTRVAMMDVKPESWENLVANNFGEKQPKGSVIVGVPSQWLASNSIELIDCPGAGDLSEERTQQISATLERTDAAIICLDATAALGQTEKEFILQRILKQKTPFAMVVINKLDLVKLEDRRCVVEFVINKLKVNKMNIPVYLPDVDMSDDTYADIIGLDKIKSVIASWANAPHRQALTDLWIKARVQDVVFIAIDTLNEQKKLFDADNAKCKELICNKKNALEQLDLLWGDFEINFQNRSNCCYDQFLEKVKEYTETTVERLQFEAGHASSPDKWWKEDYPYRLKVELANMSVGLDNVISRLIATDARWFNQMLDQKFKKFVQVESTSVTEKADYVTEKSNRKIEFEDLSRQQNIARLGTTALCIASYFTPLGFMGSMGIGAGGAVLQQTFFKKKIEEQKSLLKNLIAKDVPLIVEKAITKSEERIKKLYDSILEQSAKKKELWREAQSNAIDADSKPKTADQQKKLQDNLVELEVIKEKLN